jgi:hypothetical protein
MGEGRKLCKVLLGKPEENRPFGRTRRRWENAIEIEIRGIGWGCVEWIHLAEDRTGCGLL